MKIGETSYKETSFGIIPRSRLVELEIQGIEKGIRFLFSASTKEKTKITPTIVLALHIKAFGWIFPKWAGKFRTVRVEYSGKEAPSYYLVPQLITDLCLDLRERLKHLPICLYSSLQRLQRTSCSNANVVYLFRVKITANRDNI